MQESEEHQEENEDTWKDGVKHTEDHDAEAERFLADVAEQRDTESDKDIVDVEEAAEHLSKFRGNISPPYGWIPWIVVSVNQGGSKQEIQVLCNLWDWSDCGLLLGK